MEQLRCDLFFEVTPERELIQVDGIWSGPDLDEWAAKVEAQDGFRIVIGSVPTESRVEQEHV